MHENYKTAMHAVLGAMLSDEGSMLTALAKLRPDAMGGSEREILDSMRRLAQSGEPPSLVAVCEELKKSERLELVGGLHVVANTLPGRCIPETLEQYCDIVNREARGRALREVCRVTIEELRTNVDSALEKAETMINAIRDDEAVDCRPLKLSELLPRLQEGRAPRIETGFWLVDWATYGGLGSGWLVTIGARPGVGKTTLGLCIADNLVRRGLPVQFFSLEMHEMEITDRIVARSGIGSERACFDPTLNTLPLEIIPPGKCATVHIRSAIRRAKPKPRAVIVDYLQLVSPDNPRDRRHEQVDGIARDLKWAATEFGIPIIAMAQLNRGVEERGKLRPPVLADLRESGGIENHSDVVIMLHRLDPKMSATELIIRKNRHGKNEQKCELAFDGMRSSFYDIDYREERENAAGQGF